MNIDEFIEKHKIKTPQSINTVVNQWMKQEQIDKFLSFSVLPGVLVSDLLLNESLLDQVPPEVAEAFKNLMKDKADSLSEIRSLFLEKETLGEESVMGLINKIQGQMGEDAFKKSVGNAATLATSGSQEGWDVMVNHADGVQHVQVKIFEDADGVLEKIKEVAEKLQDGKIPDVTSIDFAVNSDIFDEVKQRAQEIGFNGKILEIRATREELRELLQETRSNLNDPLDNFFGELLGGVVVSTALHTAVNGFLYWKGVKEASQAVEDTAYDVAISSGGLAVTYGTEALMAELFSGFALGPLGSITLLSVGITSRALLKRVANRRFIARDFSNENIRLLKLCESF